MAEMALAFAVAPSSPPVGGQSGLHRVATMPQVIMQVVDVEEPEVQDELITSPEEGDCHVLCSPLEFQQGIAKPLFAEVVKGLSKLVLPSPPHEATPAGRRSSRLPNKAHQQGLSATAKAQQVMARKWGIIAQGEPFDDNAKKRYLDLFKASLSEIEIATIEELAGAAGKIDLAADLGAASWVVLAA